MTAETFCELALSLEGVEERAHMGHPDFRVGGRIFASLSSDALSATVRLTPDEQAAMIGDAPAVFSAAAGSWGRQGWTRIVLAAATVPLARGALILAWEGLRRTTRKTRQVRR